MVAQQLCFCFTRDRLSTSKGEACGEERSVCQVAAASEGSGPIAPALMEEVVRTGNLVKALKRVQTVFLPNKVFLTSWIGTAPRKAI